VFVGAIGIAACAATSGAGCFAIGIATSLFSASVARAEGRVLGTGWRWYSDRNRRRYPPRQWHASICNKSVPQGRTTSSRPVSSVSLPAEVYRGSHLPRVGFAKSTEPKVVSVRSYLFGF
jgi:hypothetical protein